MRRILIILLCVVSGTTTYAQIESKSYPINQDSLYSKNGIKENKIFITKEIDRYKLYPTPDIYNFIQLDTQTGIIYRIQWNTERYKGLYKIINSESLIGQYDEEVNGRFEIYLTDNIYHFILLDKINGRVWQCQWSFKESKNMISRIK